ncbi:hypothetical protein [Bacillus paralicheniformis]|nr:hypothetical protein [Bacillus paralicheniformis]MEC0576545.1 hypothetical protein [Bacillus paralicheniformis]
MVEEVKEADVKDDELLSLFRRRSAAKFNIAEIGLQKPPRNYKY